MPDTTVGTLKIMSNAELSALLKSCAQSADFHGMGHVAKTMREAASRLQSQHPVYQCRIIDIASPGKWVDVDKERYDALNHDARRIVYLAGDPDAE